MKQINAAFDVVLIKKLEIRDSIRIVALVFQLHTYH